MVLSEMSDADDGDPEVAAHRPTIAIPASFLAGVLGLQLAGLTINIVVLFSLILAVFLVGLGIGSSMGSGLARRFPQSRNALGVCQLLLCAAMAWAAHVTGDSLPYWPINPSILSVLPLPQMLSLTFQLDIARALWVILPGAILWGASFPLALASVASKDDDPATYVGGVYAANTLGAIVGSLGASLLLIVLVLVVVDLLTGVASASVTTSVSTLSFRKAIAAST